MAKGVAPHIRGESIQSLYRLYISEKLLTNRRYQRKLVWTIEEKISFIDSIRQGFPIPIILLAEVGEPGNPKYEIIDGMQRLNAIMSFIEQEYSISGGNFDLNTIAETKERLDGKVLKQTNPILDRAECVEFAGYQVPISVYSDRDEKNIDEVFRRLNANGKHLSRQELRQAGATGEFANLVRRLSANIRGDSSGGDVIALNRMKNISLTNKSLSYGINIDDVFWVKNKILTKEDLRNSKDEEVVADIVAWIISDKAQRSSSDILDGYYGFTESLDASQAVDRQINKLSEEFVINNIQSCFDVILDLLSRIEENLRDFLFTEPLARFPRFFQLYIIAIYEIIFIEGKEIDSYPKLIKSLRKSASTIKLAEGGGNWSAIEKERGIAQVTGIINKSFKKTGQMDPSKRHWISRFENILMNSSTEQTLYDFKLGFYDLEKNSKFNSKLFDKIILTLTAMANTQKGAVGYVIVGVSDTKNSADFHKKNYKKNYVKYGSYFITGIDAEADQYEKGTDIYFTKLTNLIKSQPISDRDKDFIGRNIFTIKYHEKTVLIISLSSGNDPSIYQDAYYTRFGSNIDLVKPANMLDFMKRFSQP